MPMSWPEDDWPQLNYGKPISLTSTARARGLYVYDWPRKWHDNFVGPKLQLGWYRKNTASKPEFDISLTERPNYLRLYPGPHKLSSPASPVALFRKQQLKEGTWKTRLSFSPEVANTEAGTAVYWNYFTWTSIGVRRADSGGRQIVFTPTEGEAIAVDLRNSSSEIDLVIECKKQSYRFGYQEVAESAKRIPTDKDISWLGEVSTNGMTKNPPIGHVFTGMMLGIYAYSDMQRSLVPADFYFAEFL